MKNVLLRSVDGLAAGGDHCRSRGSDRGRPPRRLFGRNGRRGRTVWTGLRRRHGLGQPEGRRERQPDQVDTVDYGYQVPRGGQYKKWVGDKVAAILGWGTADTEALTSFVAHDQIPYVSASYAAALTDPTGASGKAKAAPYNFFYGPSYSDALRAMLTWAAQDWKQTGKPGKPKYVHMGANHPYPNAPKAGESLAKELGFDILPAEHFALTPGDYTAQCLTVKNSGANYAYLGNTAGSNISVLKACKTAGTNVQFLGNVWGMDENRQGGRRGRRRRRVSFAHVGQLGRQCARHEDVDGHLQDL